MNLTKDAEFLICSLYKDYLDKRKSGMSKADAKFTGSSQKMNRDIMPEWSFEDVDETCRELSRAGLLHCGFADDVTYISNLTDDAIIYMENRFQNKASDVIETIAKIKSMIPFL